jgi:hypothetical protein
MRHTDDEKPVGFDDALHFPNGPFGMIHMLQCVSTDSSVEAGILKGERFRIADNDLRAGVLLCKRGPRGGEIDPPEFFCLELPGDVPLANPYFENLFPPEIAAKSDDVADTPLVVCPLEVLFPFVCVEVLEHCGHMLRT